MKSAGRSVLGVIFIAVLLLFFERPVTGGEYLSPLQSSDAYQQYLKRPKIEMAKLIYLMDRFRATDLKVIYDGQEYDSAYALQTAKEYIARHYKNENAESWVKAKAYRSEENHQIIYLKYPDGKLAPLRDVLVEELHALQQAEKGRG